MLELNSNTLINNYFKQIHTLLNSKDLNITYSGNYKNREKKIIGKSCTPKMEVYDYNINFQKFPTQTQLHQQHIEINHYFFEYYLIGQSGTNL
ncbi:MAG: hypothetical protein J7K39_01740 [Bacteroidales bacterium]|nr:hypothetical protein [Bacteroidales bacterium]